LLIEGKNVILRPMQIRSGTGPESIGGILQNLLKNLGLEKRINEQKLILNWEKIVGNNIAEKTKAFKIEGKKLFVKVESPSWRNELFYLKKEIIEKLNEFAKQEVIKDIIFIN
jgi:predicted nucleic acid-binding Zn ribbon protein